MEGPDYGRMPGDLEGIAERLREHRADPDPLELDQLKQRVLARFNSPDRRRTCASSRLATILTSMALAGGAGGALAIAQTGTHPNPQGGAADKQYHKCGKHPKPGQTCCGKNHNQKCCDTDNDKKGGKDKEGKKDKVAGCPPPPKYCDNDENNPKKRDEKHDDKDPCPAHKKGK